MSGLSAPPVRTIPGLRAYQLEALGAGFDLDGAWNHRLNAFFFWKTGAKFCRASSSWLACGSRSCWSWVAIVLPPWCHATRSWE